ncbi:inorganic phosphate transporter [Buchnera aphidicola str. APS (Acyrthosiphon pisum)]|uniref:Low-affinity inorganic phosphate transporter n=1 Tax=Buchnera aphidicola subsp. Acyrthosiphon pisum (strain APS) TaxID=107806 RepID=PIT_BUCAI|nr:inorganic phosphate transporter [Buchnera aphidicola]P57647.1 RecName: Full=Low-affinity inorganic phosphate transporter [Buchnera aphidicola str. APS (Acyrthosiphon pisum)]pir/D84998/ low-affinity inorganic phosphate transporter [imported] - Buchnera sp. (strain APS) [Buchnera sp. (in: enterobacteria)]BAB13276.1 low-affinity inorganic phosphate transporter [Buchnera aphidicola str. APS (Acyrthosiphon pisum)]
MLHLFSYSDLNHSLLVFLALFFVLFYEAINGFHDTANAVSTLIYTRAMSAHVAVIMSGIFNFLGVLLGGLTVAYTIVHLLPNDLLLNATSKNALAMVFSMLLAAIIWNLSTWYFCLPASSSHSLIGAIIGIGLTNAFVTDSSLVDAFNIPKMTSVFLSLVFSPIIGLIIAGSLIFLLRYYLNNNKIFYRIHMTPLERKEKDGKKIPPFLIRMALILSSIGVSYAHGANDGQKGIGLIMLVLIGIVPSSFLVNLNTNKYEINCTKHTLNHLEKYFLEKNIKKSNIIKNKEEINNLVVRSQSYNSIKNIKNTKLLLKNISNYNDLSIKKRFQLRHYLLCISDSIDKKVNSSDICSKDKRFLIHSKKVILKTIEYAPMWIILIVALSLSIGTMIGWKRIVVTIGEKIGKKRMTYAQAMSAQITASFSIGIASYTGIPVSTTHILSSSVAGTMLIDGDGIQTKTIKNIALAWILTLPVSMLLSSFLYWIALFLI